MISWITKKLIGSRNDRILRKMRPVVAEINQLEQALQKESEETLREKTKQWQEYLHPLNPDIIPSRDLLESADPETLTHWQQQAQKQVEGIQNAGISIDANLSSQISQATEKEAILEALSLARETVIDKEEDLLLACKNYLESILPEAFAVVKNGARRLCGQSWKAGGIDVLWQMVHFDVQLMGGIALHRGSIAEMQTGEGKTLVATLPTYLNALTGRGVHIVTVNDYLARRDAEWVGKLHQFLGLSIGVLQNQQPPALRRQQYECDITYGTASEFGFDYLRDNGTANSTKTQVQKGHYLAVVDEVDSILIDEARVPLIISGPATVSTHQFDKWKSHVANVIKTQTNFVNNLISQAQEKLSEGDTHAAGLLLYQSACGMPRNRGFLRLMEDPQARKAKEQAELFLLQDPRKKQQFELQSELYFTTDEKRHEADLTEKGRLLLDPKNPDAFLLSDLSERFADIDADETLDDAGKAKAKTDISEEIDQSSQRIHNISQLLKAYCLYEKDVHYVLSANERGETKVVIVDQNTGREMPGRRWSDGLHQAVEAKEGVKIEGETQTYATVTIQNYFRLYDKLAGMTGTAETEAAEFHDIYQLDVLVMPTNQPNQRADENDRVYKTKREKFKAVIERAEQAHKKGQPILCGTASVESSELLARMLKRAKIPHSVLNAKHHKEEAEIIARAGRKGAVTVATNMAGRGTDIKLGEGVAELGGLLVLGTERHDSRRIDRQLRGRSARQGDPGCSVFYISFEDDLMRNHGSSERMTKMMEMLKLEEGQEMQSGLLSKAVEIAQKRVEQRNYLSRKHVLEYDDVLNQQRTVIYAQRNAILRAEDPFEPLWEQVEEVIEQRSLSYLGNSAEERQLQELLDWVKDTFPIALSQEEQTQMENADAKEVTKVILKQVQEAMTLRLEGVEPIRAREIARGIQLHSIDKLWQEHLYNMDSLRQGVALRAKGQKDPLVEYKTEAFTLFSELIDNVANETTQNLFRSAQRQIEYEQKMREMMQRRAQQPSISEANMAVTGGADLFALLSQQAKTKTATAKKTATKKAPVSVKKIGRNELCPCGSGKKYKHCCGSPSPSTLN